MCKLMVLNFKLLYVTGYYIFCVCVCVSDGSIFKHVDGIRVNVAILRCRLYTANLEQVTFN